MDRRRVIVALSGIGLTVGMLVPWASASAAVAIGPVGTAAGFEDNDANLAPDTAINFDWNSFAPVTWTGTAPYQTATKTTGGWTFLGLTDAQATNSDTGFAGGTKQDLNCPTVIGSKAPNKDDLQSAYIASSIGSSGPTAGHVFLTLAWERIPQNTTSPSAHVAFEFNQGTAGPCPGTGGLVKRVAGDMLIVYDFTGGSTSTPTIQLSRWITSGSCQVGSNSPPCWGTQVTLPAGTAEGAVNTGLSPYPGNVTDTIGPSGSTVLGPSRFGEAGIDLTAAGVFSPNVCTAFGKAWAVSRTSGNSSTAAMEDLVGPGNLNLSNCGQVTIIKHTDPAGIDQDFSFTSNLAGAEITCTPAGSDPTAFTLNDAGANTEDCLKVPAGSYTVTEGAEPTGFALESLTCTAGGSQDAGNPFQANITVTGNSHVTCTYVNKQQLGAIEVVKESSKSGGAPLAGATFDVKDSGGHTVATLTTGSDGTACTDGLAFGDYTVTETAAPNGYQIDNGNPVPVTIDTNGDCSSGAVVKTFTDTPLTDLLIAAASEAQGGTQSQITCVDSGNNNIGNSPQPSSSGFADPVSVTANGLLPGTYTCTVIIDP
ncbi:MAG TPA: prealbumin-like fold domain-containing protein [Streptosporangiaceae bacterium]